MVTSSMDLRERVVAAVKSEGLSCRHNRTGRPYSKTPAACRNARTVA